MRQILIGIINLFHEELTMLLVNRYHPVMGWVTDVLLGVIPFDSAHYTYK
ncbi:hypothetical protein BTN49_1573 [Candidatus Enterovibrio escicola]|uniref:Uncharacterized protein n=1 Tax=Candidatus Enterovibrio escicola TaxID=1927127 RepID=A0A2A5T3Q2_9GAMM|nr:hypothetical protein BTN49_1573 [Candidatus Enterovibrio escacola]